MSKAIKIRKGLNIRLKGEAEKVMATPDSPEVFAVKPPDFHGLTPKMTVKVGDQVKAGEIIFFDKYNDKIKFTAPVSGEIAEIKRGAKRRILEVKILPDKEINYKTFKTGDASSLRREDVIKTMLESGTWPFLRQRPFSIVADPEDTPKAIFISGFDSHPLAPDYDFIMHGNGDEFQYGLDILKKLTDGKVHLTLRGGIAHDQAFTEAKSVQINEISGPHPAGNVGVHIHHIDPINKGEVVWYINPQDVLTIARLFKSGKLDASRVVAVAGSKAKNPKYYKTMIGACVKNFAQATDAEGSRHISGNVLTGEKIEQDGFIGFYDHLVTIIPEGDEAKFFMTSGWMSPGLNKHSMSRAYPSWLMPGKKYDLDTNLNGEERAYVMTGQYERVFPFDIYPQILVKSIIVNDIDRMEQLGIYEVDPEDFALCEYVCTSKINVQEIVREGLDVVERECM